VNPLPLCVLWDFVPVALTKIFMYNVTPAPMTYSIHHITAALHNTTIISRYTTITLHNTTIISRYITITLHNIIDTLYK
jgi:hypothetical protein